MSMENIICITNFKLFTKFCGVTESHLATFNKANIQVSKYYGMTHVLDFFLLYFVPLNIIYMTAVHPGEHNIHDCSTL